MFMVVKKGSRGKMSDDTKQENTERLHGPISMIQPDIPRNVLRQSLFTDLKANQTETSF